MIRIVLVDDQALVRAGIRLILDRQPGMVVIGEGQSGVEAMALAVRLQPTVMILDVGLPDMSGIDALEHIKAHVPQIRILMLSGTKNEQDLLRALRAGALGYVLKEACSCDLIEAVRTVAHGDQAVWWPEDPEALELLLQAARCRLEPARHSTLTERERDVMRLVAHGYGNAEIAQQLGISPKTVDTHRTHLMQKLNLHTRAAVTNYALRQGYLVTA